MRKVLTAAEMREVDRLTTEKYGIPSLLLMENAAHAVARVITEKLGGSVEGKSVLILCGKGNNGGDGAALARILLTAGMDVHVCLLGELRETKGDAKVNLEIVRSLSDTEYNLNEPELIYSECKTSDEWKEFISTHFHCSDPELIVDAMMGTGLQRPLEGLYEEVAGLVRGFNVEGVEQRTIVISVDLPTGLGADESYWIGQSLRAHATVTFTAPKLGNIIPPVCEWSGELYIANIGSPTVLVDDQPSKLYLAEEADALKWLTKTGFSSDSYKNKRGHALIVAGSEDYSGAAVMCGNSAMRSGVGLTTLLVPASSKVDVASRVIPEVIVRTIGETDGEVSTDAFAVNEDAIRQADSILVGPGLKATDKGVEEFVRKIVECRTVPVIVDAGALWFFNPPEGLLQKATLDISPPYEGGVAPVAGDGVVLSSPIETTSVEPVLENHSVGSKQPTPLLGKEGSPAAALILTPHEGEFLRLLGTEDKSAISDRVAAVRAFAETHNVILVLKGERVLVGSPDGRVVVNPTGNSGLGKAGNGDTLAGILAGFTAQAVKFEIDIFETVVAAVYVAGMAGDVAEKKYGRRVMTASDVRECLADVFSLFDDVEAE